MSVTIKSAEASATILPERGACASELHLTTKSGRSIDVLWRPDDFAKRNTGWPGGGAPILFPFGGRVWHSGRQGYYKIAERTYAMIPHGFAYEQSWKVVRESPDSVSMETEDNPSTRHMFPFHFLMRAEYTIAPDSLTLRLSLINRGPNLGIKSAMPVALGWHPYFRILPGGSRESMFLQAKAGLEFPVTDGAAGEKVKRNKGEALALSRPEAANMILGDMRGHDAEIFDTAAKASISVSWSKAVKFLVLWTNKAEAFQCVEPWMGLPDAVHSEEGLQWLKEGEEMSVNFGIRVDDMSEERTATETELPT